MKARTRVCMLGAAVALLLAWIGGQFWLAHRAFALMIAQEHARTDAWYLAHPGRHLTVSYLPASYWVHVGVTSVVAIALVTAVTAALAVGCRQWWTLLVAALPAAVVVGRFHDGTSIGQGWSQPTNAVQTWLAAGVVVDAATVLAIGALLVVALPARRSPARATSTLFRAAPPAVILIGWWLVRNPIADAAQRIWLAQAVVWVLVVALIATAALPLVIRLVVIAIVMPLLSLTVLNDLVGLDGTGFDGPRYLHHLAVAAGVTAYVVAVPWLQKLVRVRPALSVS